MKICSIFFLLFVGLMPAPAQDLDRLARELVFGADTSCSRQCYQYFMSLLSDQRLETESILTPNGVAISPEAAAGCMLEHTRTQVFVRALYQAAKSVGKEDVKILYVGCGPLAPFMTLTAPLLPKARYSLVEISENAAASAGVLIRRLGLQHQLDTLIVADATAMQVPGALQYDIIITETMDAGLNGEMMIPILIHILPQLKKDVVLIPEEVTLELVCSKNTGHEAYQERRLIFTATDLLHCYFETGKFPETEVLPPPCAQGARAVICTTVRAFRDIYLYPEASAITRQIPIRYIPGKALHFAYSMTPPRLLVDGRWRWR